MVAPGICQKIPLVLFGSKAFLFLYGIVGNIGIYGPDALVTEFARAAEICLEKLSTPSAIFVEFPGES